MFICRWHGAQESWEPKPYSPLEYRESFNAINTSVWITIFKYNEEYGKSSK